MDHASKRNLKQPDQFVNVTEQGIHWASQNRRTAIITAAIMLAVILIVVGAYTFTQYRSTQAQTAFGAAMQTYQTPVASAAQPVPPGIKTFPDTASRAAAANTQFAAIADKYAMTETGKLALYFVGLTDIEQKKNSAAEDALKKVASSWNADIAASGKLALASLYQQTGQDAKAVDLYNDLAKGHSTTVSPSLAQLQLASLYQAEGKTDEARKLYAEIKDKDKTSKGKPGAASEIASQKLNPTAAAGPAIQQ